MDKQVDSGVHDGQALQEQVPREAVRHAAPRGGRQGKGRRRGFGSSFLAGLYVVFLLACERGATPHHPASPPRPEAGVMKMLPKAYRTAVYSYKGKPKPLRAPDMPMPVQRVPMRT